MVVPVALNHLAYQTRDLAATHRFWTDAVGAKLAGAVREESRTTSSGEVTAPFLHVFYALASGECIAFFDVAKDYAPVPDGLEWWTRHVALAVDSVAEVDAMAEQIRRHGVEVRGPIDHDGVWYSVYCFDPNGVHLEITHQSRPLTEQDAAEARTAFDAWLADRAAGRLAG
ncbi:VOC family protein [Embleya scabrispora]|uniref:VOC family protein n=1 Tax=Embleya scabrispora TaxID=159449 RepID=UPI00036BBCAA|nr:VOC family protein [Embleya scabrispora]MYS85628.1 VOC family protein [Streptomyces sp. SID5474]